MKFSILIPTRDRLELLKLAVSSVLAQSYDNVEVIVSDNNSSEPAEDWLASLQDPRIRYVFHATTLPVTENWNRANDLATGDYVLMLGDDDALCKDCCAKLAVIIEARQRPEAVYYGAYMFTYPGVVPGSRNGLLHEAQNISFWRGSEDCYLLSDTDRLSLVNDAMTLRNSYPFNMQFIVLQRSIIERLRTEGAFYHSPYPDYFAMNNVMLNARSVVVTEQPLICIGVSPKSFGWYFHNNQENAGNQHLSIDETSNDAREVERQILPGTSMNTHWLLSMLALKRANAQHPGLANPAVGRYRRKQIIYFCLMLANGQVDRSLTADFRSNLRPSEKALLIALLFFTYLGKPGASILKALHTISQKRAGYVLRVLLRRVQGRARVISVPPGKNILDAEDLMGA